MKILHIVSGELTAGAARGAYWLHKGLIELGIDSRILTNSKNTLGDERVISINKTKKDKLVNFIRAQLDTSIQVLYRKRKKVIFSTGFFGFNFTKTKEYQETDIIHLHWINNGFVNIKILSKVNKPIVWTMRDMWPMTGGCHIASALNCEKFKYGCGRCKQLNSYLKYDLSWFILRRKKSFLPQDMKIIGISNWLSNEAKESFLFKNFDVRTIHNNVNCRDFYPIDKRISREILGIKTNKKIILAGAQNLGDFYKGFDKFLEAIKLLDKNKYFLIFFGELKEERLIRKLGIEYKAFGFLYDLISLNLVYNCGDVFVAPSLMDAFGKTLAEAMSCGTPVVCFDTTGPKDIVDHKKNGYRAKPFDINDLANGIEWVLNNQKYDMLRQNARKKILRNFDIKIIASKYIDLYKELLSKNK